MPPWRETAFELLPELEEKISSPSVESPFDLWFELRQAFESAYDASLRNEALISRICQYADWCVAAPRGETAADDLLTCTCVCFYERIPQHPAARDDMPRWFAYRDFIGSEQIFRYHLSEEEFLALKEHFHRHRKDYGERPARVAPTIDLER
jgi:hypothetical protein